jgi:hypothetical protein
MSSQGAAASRSSIGRRLLQQSASSSSSNSRSADSGVAKQWATAAGYVQVVGVHSSSLKLPYNSQLGAFAEALYAQRASQTAAAAEAAGLNGVSGSNRSSLRVSADECVGGAGGREPDGVNVLLPVAVPLTADTYAWMDDVLQQHTCSSG